MSKTVSGKAIKLKRSMSYHNDDLVNAFLEIWYKGLFNWVTYLYNLPDSETRDIFKDKTLNVLSKFIRDLEQLDFTDLEDELNELFEAETKID